MSGSGVGGGTSSDAVLRNDDGTNLTPLLTTSTGTHTHTIVVPTKNTDLSTTGSTETRPVNICLNFIIKY